VADQGISSVSNFVVGLFVARNLGATSFGAFTLAFVTYTVVINAVRGLATGPLLVTAAMCIVAGALPRRRQQGWRSSSEWLRAPALGADSSADSGDHADGGGGVVLYRRHSGITSHGRGASQPPSAADGVSDLLHRGRGRSHARRSHRLELGCDGCCFSRRAGVVAPASSGIGRRQLGGSLMTTTGAAPRLTLGLPVYNGERYLAASMDALLAQTFTDFELIISDNGSTDGTAAVARRYESVDPRVRYVRHPRNLGSSVNHNFVIEHARGEFFKWVSDDDLYAPDLLQRCIDALDSRPEVVLAHAWTAFIDEEGQITEKVDYPLTTDVPDAVQRFRSVLYTDGGDDIYGVIRTSVLRQVAPYGSYHWSDRTFVAELALRGPFHNTPEFLYFRRDHPMRATRTARGIRRRCAHLDPRRANWRNPAVRLVAEYLLAYVTAIGRAPLTPTDRWRCWQEFVVWAARHAPPWRRA
jgi:glycosyltransferase involved in cell wall biosynthesis